MHINSILTAAEKKLNHVKQAEALRRSAQALADENASEDSVDAILQVADLLDYATDKDQIHIPSLAVAA